MKAVKKPLDDMPRTTQQISFTAQAQETHNLEPSSGLSPPELALPGPNYVTKSHTVEAHVLLQLGKQGWEKKKAAEPVAWPCSTPTPPSSLLERSRNRSLHGPLEGSLASGETLPRPHKRHASTQGRAVPGQAPSSRLNKSKRDHVLILAAGAGCGG